MATIWERLQNNRRLIGRIYGTSRRPIDWFLNHRNEIDKSKVGLLVDRHVTSETIRFLRRENFYVLLVGDTDLRYADSSALAGAARLSGLILVQGSVDTLAEEDRKNWFTNLKSIQTRFDKLPDFNDLVKEQIGTRRRFAILADANLEFNISEFLRYLKFPVVEILKSKQWMAPDSQVATLAREHNLIIATHDRGFLDPAQHDLSSLTGIVVFPGPSDEWGTVVGKQEVLKTAMLDFTKVVDQTTRRTWVGTSINYRPDGFGVMAFDTPMPRGSQTIIRETISGRYWPQLGS